MPGTWERRWPILATLALVVLQVPSFVRTVADPLQSDFANYFVPAQTLRSGADLASLYEPSGFEAAMNRSGLQTLGSFVPHPPANALWLAPLASLAPSVAKGVWSVVLLLALLVTFRCLRRLVPGADPWLVAVVVLGPTLAIRNGLAFGQPYPVLLALLSLGLACLASGRRFLGGLWIGLTVPFKPYALVPGLAIALSASPGGLAAAGFALGAVAPNLLVVALAGGPAFGAYFVRVVPWMFRGEIQDPFSPVWGSATALAQRLFRLEPDLNPRPWLDAPGLARFAGAFAPAAMSAMGVLAARRAFDAGRPAVALGAGLAFAVAASPLAASYHLVLLSISAFALIMGVEGARRATAIAFWLLLGSPVFNRIRDLAGEDSVFAYGRFALVLALALLTARQFIVRRDGMASLGTGLIAGFLALLSAPRTEVWTRVPTPRAYSMAGPYFCGERLRWRSPSASGRALESKGEGADCQPKAADGPVVSRFSDGSWNLYWEPRAGSAPRRLTFSDANEVDPVLTPDGCAVVFASDQGRGLGSTALYRLDVSAVNPGCDRARPDGSRR